MIHLYKKVITVNNYVTNLSKTTPKTTKKK